MQLAYFSNDEQVIEEKVEKVEAPTDDIDSLQEVICLALLRDTLYSFQLEKWLKNAKKLSWLINSLCNIKIV